MTRIFQSIMALFAVTVLSVGIAHAQGASAAAAPDVKTVPGAAESDTLFERFGGKAGIDKVVADLLDIWQADPRISGKLQGVDLKHLAMRLSEQLTYATGGGGEYKGKDMKTIHDGLDIHNAHFNALVEDLQHAMDKNNIPSRTQNKLLYMLAPMQRDVVTK